MNDVSAQDQLTQQVQAKFQHALSLSQNGQLREAETLCQDILKVQPNHFDSLHMSGVIALQTGKNELAIWFLVEAIKVNSRVPSTYYNQGIALQNLKRLDDAIASYDKAISLKPDFAEAHYNRGMLLLDLNRPSDALASYEKALSVRPGYAKAHYGRALVLRGLGRLDDALASYEAALSFEPDYEFLFGECLYFRMRLCQWKSLPQDLRRYEADIRASRRVTTPFPALSLMDTPELHRMAARIYADAKHPADQSLGPITKRPAKGKIRVGYYSADFCNHPVSHMVAGLLEDHDADRFEVYGFSSGVDTKDDVRRRVSAAFHRFIDVKDTGDRDVARLSRNLGIDIAVDLSGYTQGSRPGIFAERSAPVQVNWLGYPGTMAADYFDYVIADRTVIPEGSQSSFTEKVVYLPHSYQPNDSKRKISDRVFTRQEFGLPEQGFVFCCFNNNYKILPATFSGWMRILKSVDGSVLWLFEDTPTSARNLRQEAEARGMDSSRLVFAKRLPLDEHLARHRLADLLLDTLPYNAHTTASDALWAGLPVLTCMGRSFASRVAASLLTAVGLPELITNTQGEYEARAIELTTSPARLGELKKRLAVNRTASPLFDDRLFTRHIEAAYEAMHARFLGGLPPDVIEVQPLARTP
jgi:predicted O-linked N-acetylglucosamine transferase (SPINDLY family)